ncbi:MAG: hypothetical protein OXQ31_26520 [Spirochaetaceae bacterium]|nr:hypothetical protein [Spirochaetaceae bacterium]
MTRKAGMKWASVVALAFAFVTFAQAQDRFPCLEDPTASANIKILDSERDNSNATGKYHMTGVLLKNEGSERAVGMAVVKTASDVRAVSVDVFPGGMQRINVIVSEPWKIAIFYTDSLHRSSDERCMDSVALQDTVVNKMSEHTWNEELTQVPAHSIVRIPTIEEETPVKID